MRTLFRQRWLAGAFSAALLVLAFPLAGPTPYWRTFFAWIAFVPLLLAVTPVENSSGRRALLRGAATAYGMGVLWYAGDCYWIYQTMLHYGGLPPAVSAGILALFCLILGLYFALFGFLLALIAKNLGRRAAFEAAPFLWVAIELLSSRLTQVPWDLLGYSQIDNILLTGLAPIAGVYGLSFLLMAGNVWLAAAIAGKPRWRRLHVACVLGLLVVLQNGNRLIPPPTPIEATAVLVQPNLSVDEDNTWFRPGEYDEHVGDLIALSRRVCGPYLAGMPELNAHLVTPQCPARPEPPALIAWPESPAPFRSLDPRFVEALRTAALGDHAPIVAGNIGLNPDGGRDRYNSALLVGADGSILGRYDKVHLVPWGEYVPYKQFFAFAGNLTQQAGDLTHGQKRAVFSAGGHSFGIFICYEEIFGNEVRVFVERGAQVLVNLSDDGWYGDTSAPWQTLNMARMRAVENRRWMLRDTNTGLTTVIDPYGRLTASVPRHRLTSLAAGFGYRSDLTFYTRHGDLFAELCGIISIVLLGAASISALRRPKLSKAA
jgi:apolipoprotein N-acyltransferase